MNARALKSLAGSQRSRRPVICGLAILLLLTWCINNASAQGTNTSNAGLSAAIPFNQIGAVAGKQYSGDGLAVTVSPDGARLRCAFQQLNANATTEGLWLASTADGAKGKPFRVLAQALGRASTESLPLSGKVETAGQLVRFMRPGLTEEYTVGIDGLQQDFVIEQRPPGSGSVRLELEVDGAKAEAMAGGARLVLDDGGRQMVYNRLKGMDARGKELAVKMEVMSASRLTVVLDDAAAEYPVRIDPTFSDANWISFGGVPGVSGTVFAFAVNSAGKLYVGGQFTTAGNVSAKYVAEWDGRSWTALGSGLNNGVSALAVSGTNLFAGGSFTTAGGVAANNIAQWNGSSWSALGSGMNNAVNALAVSGTNLFVGGQFTTAGGVAANWIAQWNGSSWSALGSGLNGPVESLAVSGTNLIAGGLFTTAGGVSANSIAQWNGSSWTALGSGMNNIVYALAVSGTNLFAGGNFTTAGGVSANSIAQRNGSSWSALGSGALGLGLNNWVLALAVSGTNLFAGGSFTTAGGVAANRIAKWNGSSWSALGSGLNNLPQALVVSGTNLIAGGQFTTAGGVSATNIAEWNGSSWSALGSGMNSTVYALAVSGTNLFAGGQFTNAGGVLASNIAEWNGNSWSALGSGLNGTVESLAVSGTNLFAGGGFSVAQWNGSSWSALGSGIGGIVYALAVSGKNLFAGGQFTTAGGVSANYIAQWNGSSWSALGSGLNGPVESLAVSGTNLFAGGEFTTAGTKVSAFITEANFSAPTIVSQPVNETLPIGDTANFAVSVTGYLPLDYQWYFNTNVANLLTPASLLPGATNVNPMSGPVIPSDVGNYQLIVTNAYGSATSIVATLTVLIEPNIYGLSNHIGGSTTVYLASIPGSTNRLWGTTNLSLPFLVIATNTANSNGLFQFLDPTIAGIKAKFYRLSMP